MSASSKGGLGGSNPFKTRQEEREAAARDVVPRKNNEDKTSASEDASIDTSNQAGEQEEGEVTAAVDAAEASASEETPPPPPAKEPEARVQMNTRILADRDKRLRKYQRKHAVTRQAVVDQMVDEYLQRRGLL